MFILFSSYLHYQNLHSIVLYFYALQERIVKFKKKIKLEDYIS